jgi:hypothetical protein
MSALLKVDDNLTVTALNTSHKRSKPIAKLRENTWHIISGKWNKLLYQPNH